MRMQKGVARIMTQEFIAHKLKLMSCEMIMLLLAVAWCIVPTAAEVLQCALGLSVPSLGWQRQSRPAEIADTASEHCLQQ